MKPRRKSLSRDPGRERAPGRRRMRSWISLPIWAALAITAASPAAETGQWTAAEIVRRNIEAAGGEGKMAAVRNFSFSAGVQKYTIATDGRMKVQSSFDPAAVFETLTVEGRNVRRNRLNAVSDLDGAERAGWVWLSRLAGGLFTLKNIPGPLSYEGIKAYGPMRYHVLSAETDGQRAAFYVGAGDFRVERMVLAGRGEAGERWERCYEFGGAGGLLGVTVPATLYLSQVGVGGTYSPPARPLADLKANLDLPEGFFPDLSVNAGRAAAAAGKVTGQVLGTLFDDEESFVLVFTNWTAAEVGAAGWKNGDLLIIECNGVEFETRYYFTEDQVDPKQGVYEPGNSLFTHLPSRYPMFYAQFNTCAPKTKYEQLKSRIKTLAPLAGRKKG